MPDILATSSSALLAFQRTLSTISHNVANASTEGYSRQRTELSTRGGQNFGFGFVGSGVQTSNVQRLVDSFSFSRALDSKAEIGRLAQISALSGRIDTTLSDSATGLASPFSNFFDSTQAVSTQPASAASREQMLSDARSLVNRFRSLDGELKSMDAELNQRIESTVLQVNDLSAQVAKFNVEIAGLSGSNGEPNDLLDQRERVVTELAKLTGAVVQKQDDGALNVFTPTGQALVIGATTAKLTTVADPFRPERRNVALLTGSGNTLPVAAASISGELGGLMEFRQTTLDPTSARLGRIAATLAFQFNQQHRAGMDLLGDMGGDFFTPPGPRIASANSNTGSATLTGTLTDTTALNGADIELRFDGTSFSARDAVTGAAMTLTGTGTALDPFVVGGMSIEVAGSASAGDRFLIQPTIGAGGRISVAVTDPNRIAAALPVRGSADLGNLGTGRIGSLSVSDANNPALRNPAVIDFIDATTYTIDGGAPITYAAGDTITANGWRLTLNGVPQAGDRFDIRTNVAGSSDNGNARVFALLDDAKILDAGTTSINNALQGMTTAVGTSARSSGQALDAQTTIDTRLQGERDSVSGVNLDEEAANMLRFQQAYQAASQMIGVADTIFQSLLSSIR